MRPEYLQAILGPDGCIRKALDDEGETVVLRVAGQCMAPFISNRSEVRLERPKLYIPGDVVGFYCPYQRRLLVHRFLGYAWRRGKWHLMTMADHGARPDALVNASCVIGKIAVQGEKACRVSPVQRLWAIHRYTIWCMRHIARQLMPKRR